jgi:hypothetical protein
MLFYEEGILILIVALIGLEVRQWMYDTWCWQRCNG